MLQTPQVDCVHNRLRCLFNHKLHVEAEEEHSESKESQHFSHVSKWCSVPALALRKSIQRANKAYQERHVREDWQQKDGRNQRSYIFLNNVSIQRSKVPDY